MFVFEKRFMKNSLFSALMVLLILSCSRKIPESTEDFSDARMETIAEEIEKNQLQYENLEAKVRTSYRDDKSNLNFRTTIRIQKNEKIWISGGLFGFEAVRALITEDSVKIINRLEKTYALEPVSKIEEIAGLPVNFTDFEQLLLGKIIKWSPQLASLQPLNETLQITTETNQLRNQVLLNSSNLHLQRQSLHDKFNEQQLHHKLEEYEFIAEDQAFPMQRTIQVIGDDNVVVELDFQSINLNEDLNFSFQINDRYERIYY